MDRAGLAGEVGFVAGALALGHAQIDRHLPPAVDAHDHAGPQRLHGRFDLRAGVVENGGRLGRAAQQRADLTLGAALGVVLHRPGRAEQEQQQRALVPRADRRRAERDREHQKMHVQRARAKFFPGFLRRFPRAEHIGRQPDCQRHAPGRAETFGSESGTSGQQTARRQKRQGLPFVRRMSMAVAVAVRMVMVMVVVVVVMAMLVLVLVFGLAGGQERHLARDELRPAERLPAPEADGRRAGLFFDERVAEHLLDHHAHVSLSAPVGMDGIAALRAVASGVEHRAVRPGRLGNSLADPLREASAGVVAEGGHRQLAPPRLEGHGLQPGFLAEHPRNVFNHAGVGRGRLDGFFHC